MTTRTDTPDFVRQFDRADAMRAGLFSLLLGFGLLFTIGFAHPAAIHNAAHDTRHALSFPCH